METQRIFELHEILPAEGVDVQSVREDELNLRGSFSFRAEGDGESAVISEGIHGTRFAHGSIEYVTSLDLYDCILH